MTLSNKYEFLTLLGHGAGGSVWLVQHRTLQVLRAVKIIPKHRGHTPAVYHDAFIIRNLKHPGIPLIYDIEEDDEACYIVEEYIDGITLAQYVSQSRCTSLEHICHMGIQLCSLLSFLHGSDGGILHLDLKPENILIDKSSRLWLVDFGNAARQSQSLPCSLGSKGFAAPEQYFSRRPHIQWDIYGLGMLLLYISTGDIHSNVYHIRHSSLIPIIKKCLHHNGFLRYRSADAVQHDLEKILTEHSEEITADSLEIHVTGTAGGVGVTHFCLCLTAFLNRHGYSCVCQELGSSGDYSKLAARITARNGNASYNHGAIRDENVCLLPGLNPCIHPDLSHFEVIVKDWGCRRPPFECITVGSAMHFFDDEAMKREPCQRHFFIWNLCSPEFFYHHTRHFHRNFFHYRMPCVYSANRGTPLCDRMFTELLAEMFPGRFCFSPKLKKKGGRIRDRKKDCLLRKHGEASGKIPAFYRVVNHLGKCRPPSAPGIRMDCTLQKTPDSDKEEQN